MTICYFQVTTQVCKDTLREECGPVFQTVPVVRNEHVCEDVEEETLNTICEDAPAPESRSIDIDSYGAPVARGFTGNDIDSYGAPIAPLARALPEPQQICRQVPGPKVLVEKCRYEQRESTETVTTTECKKVPSQECSPVTKQVQVKECISTAVEKCSPITRNVNQQVDERVCKDVLKPQCRTVQKNCVEEVTRQRSEEKCRIVPSPVCKNVQRSFTENTCVTVDKEVCSPHPVEKCVTISRNICKDVPTQVARQECCLVPRE